MPVHGRAFSSVPIDWQSKGPDWEKRGRTREELYIARAEGELLRSLRAEKAAEQGAQQEGAEPLPGRSMGGQIGLASCFRDVPFNPVLRNQTCLRCTVSPNAGGGGMIL